MPIKVLIVEDDEGVLRLVERRLKRLGYQTEGLSDGADALARAADATYDLLLLDYRLPHMTADQFIENLPRKIPFIVMTGQGDERIAVEMMKLGARDYLVKDSNFLDLLPQVAKQVLDQLILEQKLTATQQALRESDERLNLALKSAEIGTWSWNIPENSMIWDDYIHPLFGLGPGTFPGRYEDFLNFVHPVDREGVHQEIDKALKGESEIDLQYRVILPDESLRVLASRGKVYCDDAGKPARMAGVCWDITKQRHAEEALAEKIEELARSNAELEQFAYVASHDLQEPLRGVSGCLQLLHRRYQGQFDENADELIFHAVDGATRMKILIDDLLAYSRVKTRGKPFQPVQCEVVLKRVLANLAATIGENDGVVTHDALPQVNADETQMVQLFQNLIGNAIKYRGEQRPEIHVGVEQHDEKWLFSVRDNGIGIEHEHRERIFVIFQRLHTRDEYPGTGIGLAICRRIVERHGGQIWVESDLGKGSTFYFTISRSSISFELAVN